jgi:hypothetical protein
MSQGKLFSLPGHGNDCYLPFLVSWVCLFSVFCPYMLIYYFLCPNCTISVHSYSFLTSTNCVTITVMSQNEALLSATRPTFSPAFSPELSEEQNQAIDKCTSIIQEFQSGSISKPKAFLLLQQSIP